MPIRAVTFDCAQTLVKVDWQPDRFALDCARAAGLDLADEAADDYRVLYLARFNEFLEANLRRDHEAADRFYRDLARRWLERAGIDPDRTGDLMKEADRLAFGPESILFAPYTDSLPALRSLREMGLRTAVLSNWDYTLHRVLDLFGLLPLVDFALASLEEGVEKPDPRFFQMALDRLGCDPGEVLHVGDNAYDDIDGAAALGIHACLIDREAEARLPHRIRSLEQIPEAIACIG